VLKMERVPESVDFEMRGGSHPDKEMDELERTIAQDAYNKVLNLPSWGELGFKRAYNFNHLLKIYMTRDPKTIRLLYRLRPYPSYIEMEVTQKCPIRCIMCEHTYWDEKNIELTYDKYKFAMDQFPELKWAGNNALGDPFTNKDYGKMIKLLDDRGVVQELYATTALLKERDMEQFTTRKGFVFFKFSIDAATKETYEKIRVGIDWDRVVANIKALDDYKKKHNKYFPLVHFHFIIMKDNIHEVLDYLDFLNDLHIDIANVTYSRLLHNFPEINNLFVEIPRYLCNKLVEKGRKLNIPVSFNADLPERKPPASECTAWLMPYIFPDGTVISCCCMNEQNRRYWQRETRMGNIFETPMREIWNGEAYTKLLDELWKKNVRQAHEVCKICNIYDIDKPSTIPRD